MSAIVSRAAGRITGYAICLTPLIVLGAAIGSARHIAWPLAGLLALATMGFGPAVRGHPRRRTWRAAALLLAVDSAIISSLAWFGSGQVPAFGPWSACYDIVAYLTSGIAALLIIAGRVRRVTWLGEVDFLVLLNALTSLTWTLLALMLAHASGDRVTWLTMLVAFFFFDLLVFATVCREMRRSARERQRERSPSPTRVWMPALGAQLTLIATIGALIVHAHGDRLPGFWTLSMRLLWLVGVGILGAAALLEPDTAARADSVALRRPTPASATLLVIALLGPPVEIARPGLLGVIALGLAVMVCLLLRDARRRARGEEMIRSSAAALAGATETSAILDSTLAAAESVIARRHSGIVVCANGPDGPCSTSTGEVAEAARASPDLDGLPPAERVDRVLAGRPHLTAVAPGQNAESAPVALGAAVEERDLVGGLRSLEVLAAQAGLALYRVRLTAERARRADEARFRTLVRNAADVIMIVSADGAVRFGTASAATLLDGAEYLGEPVECVFGPISARAVRRRLRRPLDAAEDPAPEYWRLERPDGERLELEVRFTDLRADPTVDGLVLTIRDVTEQYRLRGELEHLAFHDALTGLGNSSHFAALLEAELAGDRRAGPCRSVALIIEVSDIWDIVNLRGQQTADRVLVAFAKRLHALADGASRLGGSTFGALTVPIEHGSRDAAALARRLHEELTLPVDLGTETVTTQVGIGAVPVAGLDGADAAISRAGLALTLAKTDRRRPWRVYEPSMLDIARDHAALRADLAAALAQDKLSLHYQPFVDLATGEVVGFEALARWHHPKRGSIPPSRFVPLAEETGLIVPLGRWALRRAAADLARIRALTGADRGVTLAVNVSALQLAEPEFPREVAAVLEGAGLPADSLCVEITESSVLDRSGRMLEVLRELKALGLSLAIDDFGTGHSALSYLPDLPFDTLKIDRSFITSITTSPSRAEVVRGIIHIASAIGMRVVAEGIESERQHRQLAEAFCDFGQGYLYSQPVPFDQAVRLLERSWPPRPSAAGTRDFPTIASGA